MKLGFSKEKKILCLVIHPSEINDTLNFLKALKNDNARENYLISEVSQKISAHADPDENLLVNIFSEYIDFSIRFVSTFIFMHKAMGGEASKMEEILSTMQSCSLKVN